jgi:VCBS repeat-containing protein
VNDPPVNAVPPAQQQVDENVPGNVDQLVFSTANANAISVSDVDAGSANIDVNLSVLHGTLTAVATAGVTITNNGTRASLTGSQANVTSAMNGLIYIPVEGYAADTLTVLTDDNANTGSGGTLSDTDNVSIDVVPVVRPRAKPDPVSMTEGDGPRDIDVMLNDLAHVGNFDTTLLSFTQPGPGSRGTVTRNEHGTPGVLTDDTLIYSLPDPNFFGTVTFTYTINDTYVENVDGPGPDLDSTATVTIAIAGTNDQPVAVVDPAFTMAEDATLTTSLAQSLLNNDTDLDNQYDIDGMADRHTNNLTAGWSPAAFANGGSLFVNSAAPLSIRRRSTNSVTTFNTA